MPGPHNLTDEGTPHPYAAGQFVVNLQKQTGVFCPANTKSDKQTKEGDTIWQSFPFVQDTLVTKRGEAPSFDLGELPRHFSARAHL